MCHRHHKLNVTHALTTHFLLGYFHTATVAHNALVANALVLSAVALIVLYRTENALAEESVALGLIGAVVDGFGLQYLTRRHLQNFVGRCQADGNLREITLYLVIFLKSHIVPS